MFSNQDNTSQKSKQNFTKRKGTRRRRAPANKGNDKNNTEIDSEKHTENEREEMES